ncbi:MAG: undecaprenyl-phosphate alpha-N-acetylglucosaminyl 1-phosphate transferase, partial [Candidatus Pacearchaeota archaeon]|nr:undecaprenyl-phosphate alpha-N-acetylglucosaminyl 1-phosphate transferase [Candidatus Pacearchaeota archaeon]
HHLLLEKGYSSTTVVYLLTVIASLLAAIGIAAQYYEWPQVVMFHAFLGCFGIYFLTTIYKQQSTTD